MEKIKKLAFKYRILILSIILSSITIGSSIYYIYSNGCEPCIQSSILEKPLESTEKTVKVDIKGSINFPKVYELTEGSTIEDAINLAGGLKEGGTTENINLSKVLKDEMVVYVFNKEELERNITDKNIVCEIPKCECEKIEVNNCIEKNENKSENINKTGKVSINSAGLSELMTLDGIGKSKAEAIIDYRNTNGNFKTIEEIKKVRGIGDALYEKIKNNIEI